MDFVTPIAACAVVRNGKILLIKREGKTFDGLIGLPGGKIDFGETLEQTAIKELKEETGIRSRFVRHLATIPEHIVEDGQVIKHIIIQLCEMEHLEDVGEAEFKTLWVDLEEIDSLKEKMIPSDYIMIKRILIPSNPKSHFSVIEKSGSGYVQKEFKEI